jgi:amidophosphoribosyltransferase
VARIICLGLVALQHRGQESAGIVTSETLTRQKRRENGEEKFTKFHGHKSPGLVNQIFTDSVMERLKGEKKSFKNL